MKERRMDVGGTNEGPEKKMKEGGMKERRIDVRGTNEGPEKRIKERGMKEPRRGWSRDR